MAIKNHQAPKTLTASGYVLALFKPSDNAAILVRNRATGKTVQRIARAETVASHEFQTWLANQNAGGSDIFIGMNPIKPGAYRRTKDDIESIRHVYLDLDNNGDDSLERIRNSPEVPTANFVLDTSPGRHQVVWKVDGITQREAESLLHTLASQFGGDPAATDSTRVLRMPGFANRKLAEEFIVEARQESDVVYTLHDFTIREDSLEAPRDLAEAHAGHRARSSGRKSQSENDWAYAKRALARGDDPELVIQRVAEYRAGDKVDPNYYARHTVTKAQAALEATRTQRPNEIEPESEQNTAAQEH
jgi:hypothetical protein